LSEPQSTEEEGREKIGAPGNAPKEGWAAWVSGARDRRPGSHTGRRAAYGERAPPGLRPLGTSMLLARCRSNGTDAASRNVRES